LKPNAVLSYYYDSDVFIRCCEADVLSLRETSNFLGRLQRKVWIDVFVLDMSDFIEEHTKLLGVWEEKFLDSIEEASRKKFTEIEALMRKTKKSLGSQEEMSNQV
jgi:hypothetical protein